MGLTEAGPGISSTSITSLDQAEHPGGSELWPGVNVQIRALGGPERAADSSESGPERVKAERRVLEPGEIGEICVESFGVMQCYYKNPQETAKALDRNGWLRTGDMGYLSPEGETVSHGTMQGFDNPGRGKHKPRGSGRVSKKKSAGGGRRCGGSAGRPVWGAGVCLY